MVLPDLKIVFPKSTELSVISSSSLDYTFSPLRTSDGGQYTCTATVNIPQAGITDLQNSITENITIVGKILYGLQDSYKIQWSICIDAYPVEGFEGVVSETSLTHHS